MFTTASQVRGSDITEMLAVDARAPREVPTKLAEDLERELILLASGETEIVRT